MYELKAVIRADISQFNSVMNQLGITANAAAMSVVAAFGAAFATVIALEKTVIGTASAYEDLENRMKGLYGDVEKGARVFEKWKKIAAESSFDTKELIDTYGTLFSFMGENVAEEQTLNIAAAAKLAKVNAETAASSIGAMMLKLKTGARGSNLLETLQSGQNAKLFGRYAQDLIEMARAGEDSAKILEVMNKALKEQGELALKLDEQSLSGKIKKLLGTLDVRASEMGGEPMAWAKPLVDNLNSAFAKADFSRLTESLTRFMQILAEITSNPKFAEFLTGIGVLLSVVVDGVNALTIAFSLQMKAMQPYIEALNKLSEFSDKFGNTVLAKIMPSAYMNAPTEEEKENARIQREANQRIIANFDK